MASTTTQRRKGGGPPKSQEGVIQVANALSTPKSVENDMPVPVATVKRNKCGTSPFDQNWLNMDCCGLFLRWDYLRTARIRRLCSLFGSVTSLDERYG
mmetsp:Transcript_61745/g.93219  ORF Transcript_61745/g.93219 Transcript_61745/m.93219 type:complete len:98 (-) Transcript_61745:948-1241(-)